MLDDLNTYQLMQRWGCTRQAVSQIMKRYGKEKLWKRGYKNMSYFKGVDILDVETQRQDECRP